MSLFFLPFPSYNYVLQRSSRLPKLQEEREEQSNKLIFYSLFSPHYQYHYIK